jgi:hypothetical protein
MEMDVFAWNASSPQHLPDNEEEKTVAQSVADLQAELKDLLAHFARLQQIDAFDVSLLTLRLGLESAKCATLTETGNILQRSAEYIRLRQYLILKRKICDPLFFQKLALYGHYTKLPRGIGSRRSL